MAHSPVISQTSLEELVARYRRLYSGAIADILDSYGCRNQVLPRCIAPFTACDHLAGPAFTGQGYASEDPRSNDMSQRLRMLESIPAGTVAVWSTGHSQDCAHWGEIMSSAAMQRGCTGAVIDGGLRDTEYVNRLGFPVFARFQCAASSVGRWEIASWQAPVHIGSTIVHPGDFVFGDRDGVVIVPADLTTAVLEAAESVCERERQMRDEIRGGTSVSAAYAKYGLL